MAETESLNCNICLKNLDESKCNSCTFLSCSDCIVKWYNSQDENKCPMCKKINTFSIDYSRIVRENNNDNFYVMLPLIELMISNFTLFGLGEEIGRSFHNGQTFFPDNFIENFNNWPENIRHRFRHHPIRQTIDGVDEIVAYRIEEIDDDLSTLSTLSESEEEEEAEEVD